MSTFVSPDIPDTQASIDARVAEARRNLGLDDVEQAQEQEQRPAETEAATNGKANKPGACSGCGMVGIKTRPGSSLCVLCDGKSNFTPQPRPEASAKREPHVISPRWGLTSEELTRRLKEIARDYEVKFDSPVCLLIYRLRCF